MYINFSILLKDNISWGSLMVLQMVYQKDYQELKPYAKTILTDLYNRGYVTKIQATKKDTPSYILARLSDKGKKLLKLIQTPEVTEDSLWLVQQLLKIYEINGFITAELDKKNKEKFISNRTKKAINKQLLVELIAWFLAETQF